MAHAHVGFGLAVALAADESTYSFDSPTHITATRTTRGCDRSSSPRCATTGASRSAGTEAGVPAALALEPTRRPFLAGVTDETLLDPVTWPRGNDLLS
ncbi:hypothetical protein ACFWD7_56560 [Streptomyces mirabilis]|uniref:hypothetical protein n=1 Tax=Streptomyces mirabilis TaxID=68239 RepID=UPI0036CBB8B6